SADSVDYPDYAHDVSKKVIKNKGSLGVLICGSANGVAMASNKHAGIRAAICWNEKISSLAITHNNANVLCIPARFISKEEQKKILKAFMSSDFQGGRHERRVKKIDQ
ncbi:MAG: RpiB/LacA/LacB family sugar-phosphate isomerase, partial [Bacteroidota bacterium]|nr:RpiB/LacA/LacB family sugar-phosphate isomerase [Bacteroidota bacterium]